MFFFLFFLNKTNACRKGLSNEVHKCESFGSGQHFEALTIQFYRFFSYKVAICEQVPSLKQSGN